MCVCVCAHAGVLLCACTDAARKQLSKDFCESTDMGAAAAAAVSTAAAAGRQGAAMGNSAEQRPLGKQYRALVKGIVQQDAVSGAEQPAPYSQALYAVSSSCCSCWALAYTYVEVCVCLLLMAVLCVLLQGEVCVPIGLMRYEGLSSGLFAASELGRGGKPALSRYRVLHRHADTTLVEVRPVEMCSPRGAWAQTKGYYILSEAMEARLHRVSIPLLLLVVVLVWCLLLINAALPWVHGASGDHLDGAAPPDPHPHGRTWAPACGRPTVWPRRSASGGGRPHATMHLGGGSVCV